MVNITVMDKQTDTQMIMYGTHYTTGKKVIEMMKALHFNVKKGILCIRYFMLLSINLTHTQTYTHTHTHCWQQKWVHPTEKMSKLALFSKRCHVTGKHLFLLLSYSYAAHWKFNLTPRGKELCEDVKENLHKWTIVVLCDLQSPPIELQHSSQEHTLI